MADADQRYPSEKPEDLDLQSFYRSSTDVAPPDPARTTASVEVERFLKGAQPIDRPDPGHPNARIDITDYYRPDGERVPSSSPVAIHDPAAATLAAAGESALADTNGAQLAEVKVPEAVYKMLPQEGVPAVDQFASTQSPEPHIEGGAIAPVDEQQAPAPADTTNPALKTIYRFAVAGAFLGILFAAGLIAISWVFRDPAGPYDVGVMTSGAVGLKGHLYTKWENKGLQYRLAFEPTDLSQKPGFSNAISNSPRPLSIGVQLKDAMGFVLCTQNVLVKFDPSHAPAASGATPGTPSPDLARMQADETQREQGKDVFQNMTGSNGQVESINAQGAMPCSREAYEKASTWGFLPDFPSLAEQSDWMKPPPAAVQAQVVAAARVAARRRTAPKATNAPLSFAIEGDGEILGYDPATGAIEMGSGETFYADKDSGQMMSQASWQAFPVRIHYRCEPNVGCTLSRPGAPAPLRARMRR